MPHAIQHRSPIGLRGAIERARNADKFDVELVRRRCDDRVPVATHVDERHVRRDVRIRGLTRTSDVTMLRVFQTCTHSVSKQQVEGLTDEQRSQGRVVKYQDSSYVAAASK